jgi:hypothetical protein
MNSSNKVVRLHSRGEPRFLADYAERREVAISQVNECLSGCVELLGVIEDRRIALDLNIDRSIIIQICGALAELDLALAEMKGEKI